MRKLLLLAAPALLVLAFYEPEKVTAQPRCEPMESMSNCMDGNLVTINTQTKRVSPPCVRVNPGESVTFNITPRGSTAELEPKFGDWPVWNGESVTLEAPTGRGDYDYNVYFTDGSCIDPRIRVKG